MVKGHPLRLAVVALLLLGALTIASVPPVPSARARTVALSPGDSGTYSYVFVTTNGITTNRSENMETVAVDRVNTTGSVGFVGYTETLTEFNNTILNPPIVGSNYTSIFDPYNNLTYFGQPWIGWYPFTYTDLSAGTVENLGVSVTVGVVPVNATVARSPGLIDVNFTIATSTLQALFVMKFNSTTGWLESGVTYANAFGVGRAFTYQLLSFETSTATTSSTTTMTAMTTTELTTIRQSTTETETITQPTTTTVTTTIAGASTYAYASLGATTIVILTVAVLAAWVLKGRRPSSSLQS